MGKIARITNNGTLKIKGELIEKEVIPPTLYFNGVSQAVTIPNTNNRFQPTPQTTWELWFKIDLTNHRQYDSLMGFGNNNWDIRMDGDKNFTCHTYNTAGQWTPINTSSPYSLWDEEWHHLAIVWDSINGIRRCFVDGVQTYYATMGNLLPRDMSGQTIFSIGGVNNGNSRRMNGNIKEVRIWNTARTEEEIVSNMNNKLTGDEEGLTFYLPLNEGKGKTVIDKASGFEASINGTEWIADDNIVKFNDGGDLIVNELIEENSPLMRFKDGKLYIKGELVEINPLIDVPLIDGGNLIGFGGGYTTSPETPGVYSVTGPQAGMRISSSTFEVGETYELSFKIKKISGDILSLGGHAQSFGSMEVYVNNNIIGNSWVGGRTITYPNDDLEYNYRVVLKYIGNGSDRNLYIQPNRGNGYTTDYVAEVRDLRLEKRIASWYST